MKNFITYTYYSLLISDVIAFAMTSLILVAGIYFFTNYADGVLAATIFFGIAVPALYSATVHLKKSISEFKKAHLA